MADHHPSPSASANTVRSPNGDTNGTCHPPTNGANRTITTTQSPAHRATAADPSTLPPAALDLASTLFAHARSGATATLLPYLHAGIPPNLTNSAGDTLLMLAAYHGQAETVSMLLREGADPNALNDRGQSPVAGAVFKGWGEVVKILVVEGGADLDKGQPSARECAVMFRREEMLNFETRQG